MLIGTADLFIKVVFKRDLGVKLVPQINQPGEGASLFFTDTLEFELAFPQKIESARVKIHI